ncbi:MAG: helix-turn-helix transcriptional regulator [Bacilli bacterium]|nr:helix-turn-helix transcriptional regulator [Bacilli bacterium]
MIRDYRLKRGYTLEELAEKCDISWRNLQRIENGKYNVAKFETIKKILLVLNFSDKDLFKFMKN